MATVRLAARLHAIVSAGVIVFQLALAGGAPWGSYAMGGAYPGQFPPPLRIAAVIQAALIAALTLVVQARAGLGFARLARLSRQLIWVAVAFAAVSLVLNLITPSSGERAIWSPVALALLLSSTAVAVAGGKRASNPERDPGY
jgi:hypothetical protein